MFGNHSAESCPPDAKIKMKIHFEEFLKRAVLADENAALSILNIYKRAIEERYKGIWLPINHRSDFLPVMRRVRNYRKIKPNKSTVRLKKDAATSPIGPQIHDQVAIATAPTENVVSKSPVLMNAALSDPTTALLAEIDGIMCNDMATSPMQDLSSSEQNPSTSSNDSSLVEDQMNETSDAVHQIDIRVVSNGGSTLSILASSSSLSASEIEKNSARKEVNFNPNLCDPSKTANESERIKTIDFKTCISQPQSIC